MRAQAAATLLLLLLHLFLLLFKMPNSINLFSQPQKLFGVFLGTEKREKWYGV